MPVPRRLCRLPRGELMRSGGLDGASSFLWILDQATTENTFIVTGSEYSEGGEFGTSAIGTSDKSAN